MMPTNPLLQAAQSYAERGWPVVLLHSVKAGRCGCGKNDCTSIGKHPKLQNGLKGATLDSTVIANWCGSCPTANIGIRTGADAGIVVLDIDNRHDGHKSLAELEAEHGQLPETVEAVTGGGGRHLVFKHPGGVVHNRANVRPGVDVRGDGGYIVAAPSIHASGAAYRWREGHAPADIEPAILSPWLHNLIIQHDRPAQSEALAPSNGDGGKNLIARASAYLAKVPGAVQGGRNPAAFSLAGNLAAFTDNGARPTEGQVIDLMRVWNHKCSPPLDDTELLQVVRSAMVNGTPRSPHESVTHNPAQPKGEHDTAKPTGQAMLPFVPFPTNILPEPVQSFITKAAKAMYCDESFIALPLLAGLASAIGTTRRIQLKRTWTEPAIVWAVSVADSGSVKSPALELALRPVRNRQQEAMRRYKQAMDEYAVELAHYECALAEWKRSKIRGELPTKPAEPIAERFHCDDTTVEALAILLLNQPRGLLSACDELGAWFGGFDRYTEGKGGDVAKWVQMHGGRTMTVDRKTGHPRSITIPQAAVCIAGNIPPATLARALGTEHRENGLLARLLLACPPRKAKRWTDDDIAPETEAILRRLFDRLYELQPNTNEDGEPHPVVVPMTPAGKNVWETFFNEHAEEHVGLTGDLSAAWSKLEGYTARLALVTHFIRWAADDVTLANPDAVDEISMNAGVTLSRWFGAEAERTYAILAEDGEARARRLLAELVQRRGGVVTARELQQVSRAHRVGEAAEAALNGLVSAGWGTWEPREPGGKGGRPTRAFKLNPAPSCLPNPRLSQEKTGFVDVDTMSESENDAEEWGEL